MNERKEVGKKKQSDDNTYTYTYTQEELEDRRSIGPVNEFELVEQKNRRAIPRIKGMQLVNHGERERESYDIHRRQHKVG